MDTTVQAAMRPALPLARKTVTTPMEIANLVTMSKWAEKNVINLVVNSA